MKSLYSVIQNDNSLGLSEQLSVVKNSFDAKEARKSHQLSLVDSFSLLSKYYDEILGNPELYYVPVNEVRFGSTITGSTKLFLGDLLTLWQDEPWHATCPKCNTQSLFIFGAGGSPHLEVVVLGGFVKNVEKVLMEFDHLVISLQRY